MKMTSRKLKNHLLMEIGLKEKEEDSTNWEASKTQLSVAMRPKTVMELKTQRPMRDSMSKKKTKKKKKSKEKAKKMDFKELTKMKTKVTMPFQIAMCLKMVSCLLMRKINQLVCRHNKRCFVLEIQLNMIPLCK